jgi:hypothetical protein
VKRRWEDWRRRKAVEAKIGALPDRDQNMTDTATVTTIAAIADARTARKRAHHAAREKAYRERKRDGLRCLTVEIRDEEVDVLVQFGFLDRDRRDDRHAILAAFYEFLDRTLSADDWSQEVLQDMAAS